jgi:hypothetical protein
MIKVINEIFERLLTHLAVSQNNNPPLLTLSRADLPVMQKQMR